MKINNNARERAFHILEEWQRLGGSLDLLVEREIKRPFDDSRDYQLCRALVYGTVLWLGYLEAVLARYSKHPLAKMKPITRLALQMGLYQLLFMDRIPASAAINETVKILKNRKQPKWLTGFVNGVLRTINREIDSLPDPGPGTTVSGYQSHELLSHPKWLYDRWIARYGLERTVALCAANNREADLSLRVVRGTAADIIDGLARAGITAEKGIYSAEAVLLPGYRGSITDLPGYREGSFMVQDEAAQLASGLLGERLGEGRYLDGCAGLGGKTVQLALRLKENATLLAAEPDQRRYELLGINLARLGLEDKVAKFKGRLGEIDPGQDSGFKGILIDAPCSGLGVIRRHPDIRWNRQPDDLKRYRFNQLALLEEAAGLLAPGGVLVYLTCSTEPEENEEVVDGFLAAHPDFRGEDCRDHLPERARELVDSRGFFHPLADQGLDGFFGARLVKNSGE